MIYELLFSATGRTKNVLDIFSAQWTEEKVRIDLSDLNLDWTKYHFTADDMVILATSVFEGRIPEPAAHKLKKLQGNGAKAVLLAVFGNRAVDDALIEMRDVMTQAGFIPVAAMEASTQHSIVPQVEAHRPDGDDKKEIAEFAEKIKATLTERTVFGQLNVPGNIPYIEMGGVKFKPITDSEKCVSCGLCAKKCPVMAIPKEDPKMTCNETCITCMRCVAICPVNARALPEETVLLAYTVLKPKFDGRKPNKLYIAE